MLEGGALDLITEELPAVHAKLRVVEGFLELLTRDCDFAGFMSQLLRSVMEALPCEASSMIELDYSNQTLFFRAVEGQGSDRVHDFVIPFGQGVVGHVALSRKTVVVNQLANDSRHLRSISETVGFPVRNLLAVPVVIRGRTFAVLELLNRTGSEHFGADDVALIESLAFQVARVIEVRLMMSWALRQAA